MKCTWKITTPMAAMAVAIASCGDPLKDQQSSGRVLYTISGTLSLPDSTAQDLDPENLYVALS